MSCHSPRRGKRMGSEHCSAAYLTCICVVLFFGDAELGLDHKRSAAMELNPESFLFGGGMTKPEVSNGV